MENKNNPTGGVSQDDAALQLSSIGVDQASFSDPQALSDYPVATGDLTAPMAATVMPATQSRWRWGVLFTTALLFIAAASVVVFSALNRSKEGVEGNASNRFGTTVVSLDNISVEPIINLSNTKTVTINGTLTVREGLIVAPSIQPSTAQPGQIYYDINSNTLAYFNGTQFVSVGGNVVKDIDGATGNVAVGAGLSNVDGQIVNTGVLSVQGQAGNVTLTPGNGIAINGTTISNTGIISVVSSSPSITVSNDGNGNITLSGSGSGTVSSLGGTTGRLAKFTNAQEIGDSLVSESGTTVLVTGDLNVTGSITLGSPLTVANGGTGASTLAANGVLVGNGTGAISSIVAANPGQCLTSTLGAPAWAACSGGGGTVTSLNGLTGALTIANATGSVNTITINDASTSGKGIASFDGSNFTVTSGAVNTVQNISSTSSPTFVGVNTNNITPSSTLTVGASTQTLSLLGNASSTFSVTGSGQTTVIGFSGIPTGLVAYNFDRSATAGTYQICTTAANCVGMGGGVTTLGGTADRLTKFTGTQTIGNASLSDDGSLVTVLGTANLTVQGGTGTFGTLTQAGNVVISDGSSNTATIVINGHAANRTYTIPDAGANADFCLSSGNCIGGVVGGAPNGAEYLVLNLNGTLTNERALTAGSNISFTDSGANGNLTVATVQNPTFTTSVTSPVLQSSGVLTISSTAGNIVAIDAGSTIELQDNSNVTGNLDISGGLNVGSSNAFVVSGAGAITAATGITSSGTITFTGLNCTSNANGGALTTNGSGQLICSDDDGGAGSAISGSGTAGTVPLFNGAQTITNSIITQSGTTISIAGDLTLTTALSVANGGTGATSFTTNGLVYGNGTGALQVTAAGTSGQVVVANASGVPTFVSVSGDVSISNAGVVTIQANSVALGTDTVGDYVANLGALTGLTTSGNSGEGSTPTLSVTYGSLANTAVQGNVTLTCPSGTGNLTGGGTSITLGTGGACGNLNTVNNPSFTTSVTTPSLILTGAGSNGTIQVGNLGQGTVYTLPDPGGAAAAICISTGNCTATGTAGGDLTGTYPNPTIAKLQNTNLSISSPTAGHILIYNGSNSQWENHVVSSDIVISETGVATVQSNAVALGADTTGNYVIGLTAGNGVSITGSAGEGWSPTVAVVYGSSANTAVEGNTSLSVTAGTNLTGGGSVTLGAGGSVTLNVANSPIFSGTLTVQGATATVGGTSQQGSVVLNDGSSNTGTLQTAALGQNTTYTLPDPGTGSVTLCVSTGNCAGAGSGVTTSGGTADRVAKFTGAQSIGDSSISDDGTTVTINGTANLVVQGGTGTFGTTSQAGSIVVSDGSSNTVSIVAAALAANRTYTLPDAGGNADFCLSTGNCVGGGGGSAPNGAEYLVLNLNGTLTNERALTAGSNISFTDSGANGNLTVATVQNPTFTTSVTTPLLQSSGALTISSTAGNIVAIDAGTTIELQDSTNVTGSLDVSVALNVGTLNAFQVSSAGAIAAATGITSSGTIIFSALDCTTFANGGAVTTNGSGQLSCSDDNGAAANTITGSGTSGTVPVFNGTQTITDSIITQSGTTISIAGDLTLTTALTVANGGTGATSFTSRGVLYGNGTGAIQVTAAGTGGQVLIANASGDPTFATFSGDVTVSNTGTTTIQANSVALGTDTVGDYVANLGTLTGLTTSGNSGEGSTPTLSVTYGSGANSAVQGNTTLTCPSGTGNLTGGGTSITLGTGGACGNLNTVNNPSFTTSVTTPQLIFTGAGSNGTLVVGALGQATTYTLPDPGAGTATICLSTNNCTATGTAGGDLTGSYPNPTIAKLQGGTLTITSVASGNILQYNGSAWVNQSVSGDITLSSAGVATIANDAVTSAKIDDGTIVNADLATGSFTNITGVGTLTSLTVAGAASINTSGTANTSIGNATGTLQLTSAGLNVSVAGALTGVSGITSSGSYVQSGSGANTFTGATTFSASGTAVSITNDATIGGTLTVNNIVPNGALTIGSITQSFTLRGTSSSTITADDGGNTTTIGFVTPTADTTLNFPALPNGTYTMCTSSGNCGGVGATLQTAYNNSTATEITLDATRAALTIRDNSTPLVGNLFEVQNNTGSTTFFNVTSAGINVTGAIAASGNIDTTGGNIQTNSVERISNGGNLVNIGSIAASGSITFSTLSTSGIVTNTAAGLLGTVSTVPVANGGTGASTLTANGILYGNGTGAIQATAAAANSVLVTNGSSVPSLSQTLPTAVQGNITGTGALASGSIVSGFGAISTGNNIATTAAVQGGTATFTGASALTLGTASTNTGAIVFRGSGGAGTLTLAGPTTPNGGNFTLTIPAITADANVCTDNSVCAGYAPSTGSTAYATRALDNLSGVAINAALGFQANQAANINFAASAAAAGNLLTILGQTAGGTGNNGGGVTIQGGTGTTTGSGGTTTVRGGDAAATGTNGTLTLDAGSGATVANGTINLGNANASTINIGVNNTLTSTIQIGATAQSAGTQTINIGNSNTAGGTTNVVIGAGSTATGGTTTVRAKGALTLTGGAASTWDAGGTLSLQTATNSAITTGTGLWTQGGNLTFNGTAARTITGPATGGLTVNVTSGPLTLSTTTSGTLAVTSAGALNLTGAANSTWSVGAGNTLGVTSSNFTVSTGGVLNVVGGSAGFQIGGAATTGNYLRGNGTSFVSSAIQSGDIPVCTGSCNYISNQTSQQSNANFNILSAAAGSIGGQIQGAASSTAAVMVLKGGATPGAGADLLQLQTSSATVARFDSAGNLQGVNVATATTGTTTGTGTNTTTLTLTSDAFSVNDVVLIDNAGQDYYTRITVDPGTGSYTVSPAVTFETGRTVTKYNIQNFGATATDYTTQTNRFFQGYFLGGIVAGAGSTTLSDGRLASTGRLNVNSTDVVIQNTTNSTTALQVQNAGSASILNVDTTNKAVTVNSVAAAALLDAKVDYATASSPLGASSADFDKDGDIDMAVANSGPDTVSVFMNNGNGTFAAKTDYSTGLTPSYIATADFDKDGDIDMAVTNGDSASISILMNNGSGSNFTLSSSPTTGTNPRNIIAADFDKDGDVDMAVTNYSVNTMSVFLNNGTGGFAAKVDYATDFTPFGITSADFDKDGDNDVAVANNDSDEVSIFMNNGSGTFAAKVDYNSYGDGFSEDPNGLVSGDVDQDGDADLVTVNDVSNTLSVIFNSGGTFNTVAEYNTGVTPTNLALSDIDKDGDLDVVTTNRGSGTISIFKNSGNGTYAPKVDFASASNPYGVIAADFDKDGDVDVAATNNGPGTISVFINTTLAVSPITTPTLTLYSGGVNDSLQVRSSDDRRLFSIDARGNTTIGDPSNSEGTLFASHKEYATGDHPYGITNADFDKDGDNDLAVVVLSDDAVSILLNNGNGTFATHVDYPVGSTPISVTAADLDKDSDIDLIVTNEADDDVSVLMNNGNGTFAAKVDYAVGDQPEGLEAIDLDKDGDVDIAVVNSNADTVSILKNNGNGTFAAKVDYTVGQDPYYLSFADFDKDGDIDLVTANQTTDNASVLMNSGTGTFAAKVDYAAADGSTSVKTADFDKDGDVDFAVGNNDSVSVFMNNGNGTFAADVEYTVSNAQDMAVADFDKDGSVDIAVVNDDSPSYAVLLMNNGSGVFGTAVNYGVGYFPIAITSADFDKDGDVDIATADESASNDTTSVLLNNTIANGRFKVLSGDGSATLFSLDATGAASFKTSASAVSAFQVLKSNDASLFNIDTATTNTSNLITNSGFEGTTSGWDTIITCSLSVSSQAYTGQGSGKCSNSGSFASGMSFELSTTTLASSTTYTMSFYAKAASGSFSTFEFGRSDNGSTETACLTAQTVTSAGWKRFDCTFTTGTTSNAPFVYIKQTDTTARDWFVDAVMLQIATNVETTHRESTLSVNSVISSQVTIQNSQNSENAFQINNASGNSVLSVDTSGGNQNNLITNPSFETNTTGWIALGTPSTFRRDTAEKFSGNASLRYTTSASNDGARYNLTLTTSTNYTISFYTKVDSATDYAYGGWATVGYNNGTADTTATCTIAPNTALDNIKSTSWQHMRCTMTSPASNSGTPYFFIRSSGTGQTYYIDGVLLQTDANADTHYREGKVSIQGTVVSPLILQNSTNSSTAFSVQNKNGSEIFGINNEIAFSDTYNAITNSDFEMNTTGWTTVGSGTTMIRDTSRSFHGRSSLKVTTGAVADSGVKFVTGNSGPTALEEIINYNLSFYVRTVSGTITDMTMAYSYDGNAASESGDTCSTFTVTSTWTRVYCTIITNPSAPNANAYFIIKQETSTSSQSFYIDGVLVTQNFDSIPPAYNAATITLGGTIVSPMTIRNIENSSQAFAVQGADNNSLLLVDTANRYVHIGDPYTGYGTSLVLDNHDGISGLSPQGTNGAMYYNTTDNKFRCYENGAWRSCLGVINRAKQKTASESLSSSVHQNDDHLFLTYEANKRYSIIGTIYFQSPAAADIKFRWTYSGTAAADTFWHMAGIDTTDVFRGRVALLSAEIVPPTTDAPAVAAYDIRGTFESNTAGTLQLQWAQATASGTTTVYKGSWIELMEIN